AMVMPGAGDKVMHASFRIGESTVLASDGRCEGRPSFQGFALSLTVPGEAEAERLFTALGEGGQVQMPLTKTFFSPRFGMVADRRVDVIRRRVGGGPGGGARIGDADGPQVLSRAGPVILLPQRLVEEVLPIVGAVAAGAPIVDVDVDEVRGVLPPIADDAAPA